MNELYARGSFVLGRGGGMEKALIKKSFPVFLIGQLMFSGKREGKKDGFCTVSPFQAPSNSLRALPARVPGVWCKACLCGKEMKKATSKDAPFS